MTINWHKHSIGKSLMGNMTLRTILSTTLCIWAVQMAPIFDANAFTRNACLEIFDENFLFKTKIRDPRNQKLLEDIRQKVMAGNGLVYSRYLTSSLNFEGENYSVVEILGSTRQGIVYHVRDKHAHDHAIQINSQGMTKFEYVHGLSMRYLITTLPPDLGGLLIQTFEAWVRKNRLPLDYDTYVLDFSTGTFESLSQP